jgi:type IX secretion system PorP/SprF family membrane protein
MVMKMRILLILGVCLSCGAGLKAQSEPQFSHYMYNRYLTNAAYSGSSDAAEFFLVHRSQYLGISNRMVASQAFNFNMPIYKISSGVGLTVINDFAGYQRSTYVSANYVYRKKFGFGNLGIGAGVGLIQAEIDGSKLVTPDGNYEGGVNHNDNILPTTKVNGIAPDLAFGIYLNNERFFAGAAINHIAFSNVGMGSLPNFGLEFSRNLLISGGYDFKLGRKLSLMPSAFVKTDFKKVQAELAVNLTIIDNILTGISFRGYDKRSVDALCLFGGFRLKGFQLVYSYDANFSYLRKFNTGSHEISLSYRLNLQKPGPKGFFYHNPRFLGI